MPEPGSNFINADKLFQRLETGEDWVIIDARADSLQPQKGRETYMKKHIPGAVYMPLEFDYSDKPGEHGGRHPLPDPARFSKRLIALGVDPIKPIVIYEHASPENSARLWWMLKYWFNFEKVFILNGGFQAWVEAGYNTDSKIPIVNPGSLDKLDVREEYLCNATEILKKINGQSDFALIDARAPERFLGQEELIDPVAGHIPGAFNFFWNSAYKKDGKILDVDELLNCMSDLAHYDDIVVYCGSGVTACATILAMDESGIKKVRLYPGSWSDWITYPEYPKVTP